MLERDAIGASWRRHYDRLLPRRYGSWVARDDVVEYLEDYVRVHNLDVRTGVEVEAIARNGAGWQLRTTDGELGAPGVVVARGYNRHQHLPRVAGNGHLHGRARPLG